MMRSASMSHGWNFSAGRGYYIPTADACTLDAKVTVPLMNATSIVMVHFFDAGQFNGNSSCSSLIRSYCVTWSPNLCIESASTSCGCERLGIFQLSWFCCIAAMMKMICSKRVWKYYEKERQTMTIQEWLKSGKFSWLSMFEKWNNYFVLFGDWNDWNDVLVRIASGGIVNSLCRYSRYVPWQKTSSGGLA